MDHVSGVDIDADSTFVLALEAQRRGHTLYHYLPSDLSFRGRRLTAHAQPLEVRREHGAHASLGAFEAVDLGRFDVVLMRQDPPFDLAYITATHLLEHIHPATLVVNDPVSVRNAPEKLFATHFPELMPPTLITNRADDIHAFRREHRDIIVKPLHGKRRRRSLPPPARRREPERAARDVRPALARAVDDPALSSRGAGRRQAHHPRRRRAGRRGRPHAGGRRGACELPRRRHAPQDRPHAARPRDLRGAGAGAAGKGPGIRRNRRESATGSPRST